MPKRTVTFICGFLIPNLNEERFGENLKWIDKENGTFEIEWRHKGGPSWTEREAEVFAEWDKRKGHYQPGDKMYYPKSKQRFRSLLYKLTKQGYLMKLKSDEKFKKIYRIVHKKSNRNVTSTYESSRSEFSSEGCNKYEETEDSNENYNWRMISDDKTTNILEDHTYSSTNQQNTSSESENEQGVNYLFVKIQASSDSLKYSREKVLALKENPEEYMNYKPTLTIDGGYMHNTTESLSFDKRITSDIPLQQIPEPFPANTFSFNLNRHVEERYTINSDCATTLSLNENSTDEISETLFCSPVFRDGDIILSEFEMLMKESNKYEI